MIIRREKNDSVSLFSPSFRYESPKAYIRLDSGFGLVSLLYHSSFLFISISVLSLSWHSPVWCERDSTLSLSSIIFHSSLSNWSQKQRIEEPTRDHWKGISVIYPPWSHPLTRTPPTTLTSSPAVPGCSPWLRRWLLRRCSSRPSPALFSSPSSSAVPVGKKPKTSLEWSN